MATIKVNQTSIDELKSAIIFSAEQTSQAAELVAKAVNGISGMSFSAKYGLESDLTSLKNRLNKQAQLSQACYRAVQEAVDALAQVDDSAGSLSAGAWGKITSQVNTVFGAVAAGLALAAKDKLGKQSDINGSFIDGSSNEIVTPAPLVVGESEAVNVNQTVDHSIPFISAYEKDRDASIWPEGYSGFQGCAVASTSSALSGLLGERITPKEIMSYQGDGESMLWGNCASVHGVSTSAIDTGDISEIDKALNQYLDNPGRYSAPIIGSSSPQHYVVVTGKNLDGSYTIIDSSGYNAKTYTYSPSTPQLNGSGFMGNLVQVIQYQKEV